MIGALVAIYVIGVFCCLVAGLILWFTSIRTDDPGRQLGARLMLGCLVWPLLSGRWVLLNAAEIRDAARGDGLGR